MKTDLTLAVLDADSLPGTDWKTLFPDFNLKVYPGTTREERLSHIGDAELVITSKVPFEAELFQQLPKLSYVGVMATGYNNIDVKAAALQNVTVCNIPGYSTMSVAQYVFAFINELYLNFSRQIQCFPDGTWERSRSFCYWEGGLREMAYKRMGLVGMGAIGSAVARIALAYEMKVCAYTPSGVARVSGVEMVSQEELFSNSDIISLHCPLTPSNRHLINAETLAQMKPSTILINTARGALVDESALAEALKTNRLAGTGMDVVEREPPDGNSPLLGAPNVVVTPHQAWATGEALQRLKDILRSNLYAYLAGKTQNKVG